MKTPSSRATNVLGRLPKKLPLVLILAWCIGLTGCFIHLAWGQSWPETSGHAFGSDDAFITYRYAENLVKGDGLVFNQGERAEGYSNLGYVFLIAIGSLFTPRDQIYFFSFAINCLSFCAAIYFFWKLALLKLKPQLAGLATLLFSLFPPFFQAVASGLETPFVVAGQLTLLYAVCRAEENPGESYWGLVMASAFLVVIRADGFVSPILAVLYLLLNKRYRSALSVLLAVLVPFTCIEIFRLVYYGYPLPNTYYAKVDGTIGYRILSAFRLILVALPETGIMPYVILTLTPSLFWGYRLLLRRKEIALAFPNFFGAGIIGYWIWVGGDIFWERFLLICYPIAILTIFALVNAEFRSEIRWQKRKVVNALVVFVLVFNAVPLFFDGRFFYSAKQYDMFRELGHFLGENYPGKMVAVDAAGKIPFFSNLRAIDMLGLNDVTIAHRQFQSLVVGHNKFDPDYVLSRHPDLIVSWISVPSYDLDWGMARNKYSPQGYCLKYLVYSGLEKKKDWIVAAENASESTMRIEAGWNYAVLVRSDNCQWND